MKDGQHHDGEMVEREEKKDDAAMDAVRQDVLDNVTSKMVQARGVHIAVVNLKALDKGGLNTALHDLSPIPGPVAEKRLFGAGAGSPGLPLDPPRIAPNPFD